MERDEIRTKVSRYIEENALSANDLALRLHSRMTGDDVTRFLSGQDPVDESPRGINVASVIAMFAYSLEPDGSE